MRRFQKRLGALLLGLLMTGCARPVATAAVTLTVAPERAATGQTVTLTVKTHGGARLLPPGSAVLALVPTLCIDDCAHSRWDSVSLAPVGTDGNTFVGQYTLPLFFPGPDGTVQPLPVGAHALSLSCLYAAGKGCFGRTQAEAKVEVIRTDSAIAWQALPRIGQVAPLPEVGGFSTTAVDPTDSRHRVTCQPGSPTRIDLPDVPRLEVSRDGGATLERISLVDSPFAGQHGIMGCRTVALDPAFPDSFYGADAGNTGNHGGGMTPPPYYSADHGRSWHPVPLPDGFAGESGPAFRGFTMSAHGVTAWFSTAVLDGPAGAVAGVITRDGGKSWTGVALSCGGPRAAPACARQLATEFLHPTGLIRSSDSGRSWDWARYRGTPVGALAFADLGAGRFLAVGAGVGKEFIPLLYSPDAGATWRAVVVPAPPDGWVQNPASPLWQYPQLQVQPDGSLLHHRWDGQPENQTWYRLAPGATGWEVAPGP